MLMIVVLAVLPTSKDEIIALSFIQENNRLALFGSTGSTRSIPPLPPFPPLGKILEIVNLVYV